MDVNFEERFIGSKFSNSNKGVPRETREDLVHSYENLAATYEQDYENSLECEVHSYVANKLCEIVPESVRDKAKVLDVGAGTGLLGKQIRCHGFVHIDALEPSPKMLDEARKRHLYHTYFCEYITGEQLGIAKGTYDVVVGIGMLGLNHAPFSALREMARLTKSGGHVIVSLRRSLVEDNEEYRALEPLMRQMETGGTWRMVARDIHPNYYKNVEGIIYVFRVRL